MKGGGTLGVLQRFERRLEGMVEGAFARAFRSELQPVEVASAVQREMDDRAAIVAKGRTLVPNDFVVELAETDHERLDVYAESLGVGAGQPGQGLRQGRATRSSGPVRMRFEGVPDMTTGHVPDPVRRHPGLHHRGRRDPASPPATCRRTSGRGFHGSPAAAGLRPRGSWRPAGGDQHTCELQTPVTLLGRGTDCDLRLVDPGVSRHHAELRVENGRGRAGGPEFHQRHLRQRPAGPAGGAHRRDARLAGPDHAGLPPGRARTNGQGTAYSRTTY